MKALTEFIAPVVERAISQTPDEIQKKELAGEPVCFADSLSKFHRDGPLLRDQLRNLLLGGRDTIAANLSWLFYELSYHPDVYAELRAEVHKVIGTEGKSPTYEDLKKMTYLQHCLNESNSTSRLVNCVC